MTLSLMKQKKFRNYFFSDIIGSIGAGMLTTSLNWFVLDKTNSVKLVGYLLSANVIAGLIVSLFIGLLIDRFNRKIIMICNYLFRIITMILTITLLIFTGFREEYMFFLTIINGICWTLSMAASRSFVQEIILKKDFINGNSLLEISMQVGMFMAGALSGVLYKYLGFNYILIIDTIIFIFSIIFLCQVEYKSEINISKENSFYDNLKEGLSYLKNNAGIFILGIVAFVPAVVTAIYNVVLPAYVVDTISGDSVVFGISDMFYGIGGFLSGFIGAAVSKELSKNKSIVTFYLVAIGILVGVSFNRYALVLYIVSCLLGITNSSIRIVVNTIIMNVVPRAFMGRAMSVWVAISLILQAISSSTVGILIDSFSSGLGFIYMSALMFLGFVLVILLLKKYKLDMMEGKNGE